jgi:hypothetical protein
MSSASLATAVDESAAVGAVEGAEASTCGYCDVGFNVSFPRFYDGVPFDRRA